MERANWRLGDMISLLTFSGHLRLVLLEVAFSGICLCRLAESAGIISAAYTKIKLEFSAIDALTPLLHHPAAFFQSSTYEPHNR